MPLKRILFLLLLFSSQLAFNQVDIDSLKNLLNTIEENQKAEIYNKIAYENVEYQPDTGIYYAQKALIAAEEFNNKKQIAEAKRNIGISLNFNQEYDSSLVFLNEAKEIFIELHNQEGEAKTLRNIGRLYENQYDYKNALELYLEALKIFEKIETLHDLGGTYQDIGYVYLATNKFEQAIEYYNHALEIFEKEENIYAVSIIFNSLGTAYDSMGEIEQALDYYNKSVEINKQIGNDIVAAYIQHNIGIIYNNQGNLDSALSYFTQSLKVTEQYEDPYGTSYNLSRIATIYKKQEKLDDALEILDKSLDYLVLIDDKPAISENYLEYSNIYELKKDFKNAFEYYQKYDQLKDTIFNDDMLKQMNELETKYQTEKKEAENLLLKEQGRKQQVFNYFLGVVIFLVLIIAIIFFRGKRKQQKVNKLLEQKNVEINQQKEEIQAQAEELEKLSIVASETDNAVVIMDKEGNFEWINNGFTRLYGFDLLDFKNKQGGNIFTASSSENIKTLLDDCVKNKKSVSYESRIKSKSDNYIWAQTTITPIIDSFGNISKLVAIDSDISKLKKAEAEILQKNEEIMSQRNELERINEHIERQNEMIKGSIRYAKTIQNAILPSISEIEKKYSTFLIYKPKDIVSGDFYWYLSVEKYDFVVVADCTGHGVPGAFMSMISSRLLNEVIAEAKIFEPKDILENVDKLLKKALNKEDNSVQDGMDLVLCRIEKKEADYEITYSGAKRSLIFTKNQEINTLKADRRSLGGNKKRFSPVNFTNQVILLNKNDIMYLFTDGYIDQNDSKRTRFGSHRLFAVLENIKNEKFDIQKEILEKELDNWQKTENQRDDITFLALQLK